MDRPFLRARSLYLVSSLVVFFFATFSSALRVTPGSECAAYCLDNPDSGTKSPANSTTTPSDIVCNNADYWSTAIGTKYRTCLTCLQNSTVVNGSQSDVGWYLYNIRYAVDVCLYASPGPDSANTSTSTPCALTSNCQPLQKALEAGNLNPSNETEYQYCTADGGAFEGSALESCVQCLQTNSQQTYLSNFLTALSAGCQQKPPAGDLLGINGTLFGTTAVNIITPLWNQTDPGPATPVTALTTGTIVGIAVGAALLLFGALALFFLYWRKQKRAKSNRLTYYQPDGGPFRQVQSISSSITVPYYTTDYKKQPTDQRNYELYDKIKTQQLVIPGKRAQETAGPETAALWGRDTPLLTRHQLSPRVPTPASHQGVFDDANKNLDEMPTHPAFIPRAFTRGSRIPPSLAEDAGARVRSNKPDTYAMQRYLDAAEASNIDMASLNPPSLTNIPPPPPGPPPSQNANNATTPSLVIPSASRMRTPKRYIPPPLNIAAAKPKAQRIDSDSDESKLLN